MKLRARESGEEFDLRAGLVLGRSAECDVTLADSSVSRRHARVEERGGSFWVVDLDSSNGTRHNGRRAGSFAVRPGDLLTVGTVALDVLGAAGAAAAPVEEARPRAGGADSSSELAAQRARLRAEIRATRSGLGDLGQQPFLIQAAVVVLGLGLLAGVFYGVRWLGGMIAPH